MQILNLISEITGNNQDTLNTKEDLLLGFNKSCVISSIASALNKHKVSVVDSYKVASSFVSALDYIRDSKEDFLMIFAENLQECQAKVTDTSDKDNTQDLNNTINFEDIESACISAGLLKIVGESLELGELLGDILQNRQEAIRPILESDRANFKRIKGYSKVAHSNLFVEAVHVLEKTQFTVDPYILELAIRVQEKLSTKDSEAYVLEGSKLLDPNKGYFSEFKGDNRGRLYQVACHGPISAAGDRSRALQDLANVPTNYNVKSAYSLILAEMGDMTKDVKASVLQLNELGAVDFIIANLGDSTIVAKPWSFVKATRIMKALKNGKRPYIGMAIGLDAKCSGPQLAALMVGDSQIAQACGVSLKQMEDAYHIAQVALEKAGFTGLTRAIVKKPYMAIFYGQGYAAFTNIKAMKKNGQEDLVRVLYGDSLANDDIAKKFHMVISKSFGAKMNFIRSQIKAYGELTNKAIKHYMPDGFEVGMNYKEEVNTLDEVYEYETKSYDLSIICDMQEYKFINAKMKTKNHDYKSYSRNGFVNLIQATDALLARLIVVNLDRLGAQHVLSIHDCFRVNIHEMELLKEAIRLSYQALFGNVKNKKTSDLIMGTNFLKLYFEGADKSVDKDLEVKLPMISQFRPNGMRKFPKIQGKYLSEIFKQLGDGENNSYYFAK